MVLIAECIDTSLSLDHCFLVNINYQDIPSPFKSLTLLSRCLSPLHNESVTKAILTVTSPIVINVPTRGLLVVETKDSFVLWLAKFKYQKNCL